MKYLGIIILCLLILFTLYINTIIIEGSDTGPNLPSGGNQGSIKDIDDMRTFLEQMYMICLLNPNDQTNKIQNTNGYKISLLGTYLWPLLAPYTEWTLDDLSPLFGTPTNPTSVTQGSAAQSNGQKPKVPIIASDDDYTKFLELAILGKIITPYSTDNYNNGYSVVVWSKDINGNVTDFMDNTRGWVPYHDYWGAPYYFVNTYLHDITMLLAHFHGQTTSNNKSWPGDSQFTEVYPK